MLDHMTFDSLSASFLLRSLTTNEHHPHLLLDCSPYEVQCILFGLEQWGERPITHSRLPGPLVLPRHGRGTLLIENLHQMNLTQQLALYDWLVMRTPAPQIISVASRAIDSMVRSGQFLECLFTRLSTVRLDSRVPVPVGIPVMANRGRS